MPAPELAAGIPGGGKFICLPAEAAGRLTVQPVPRVLDQRCSAQLHPRKITAAIRQPLHRRQAVRLLTGRQPLFAVRVPRLMLPQHLPRLRGLHRLPFARQTAFIVIAVVDRHTVAFTQVADFCQPAVIVILPLLRRFTVHRAPGDTVRRIVMPEGDKPLIFTLREFSGQVILVTLRPAVKAALLRQPVDRVIPERGLAAVLVGQHSDAPGGVIPHASRQTALRGADGLSPRIILYLTAAAVRGNDSGEVSCGAVLITGFTPLRIPLTDQLTARVITAVSADAFFPVNGDLLTVPVILIPRRVPRAVRKRLKLTVPVSRYSPPHPGSVFHRTGQATAGRIIKPARNVTVARGLFRQPALTVIFPAAA
ncbi:Uncharacterised protein [Shigella sonnei]|nr:Uncharacterised protein [Shigella sonnei]CSQ63956.1 Uncharacterised protein [Shigella sonnei]SJE60100.1 Uncharacterised protein [Shigella sonnei]